VIATTPETLHHPYKYDTLTAKRVDIHRHIEGSIFIDQIVEIAKKMRVAFDSETIEFMQAKVEQGLAVPSLESFIQMLSTRWLRLLIAKVMIDRRTDEKSRAVSTTIDMFFKTVITHAFEVEELQVLNLLFSPRNLSVNGDLHPDKLHLLLETSDITPEEKRIYETLILLSEYHKYPRGITWQEYTRKVGKLRRTVERKFGYKKRLTLTLSLRRNKFLGDLDFLTDEENKYQNLRDLHHLFVAEMYDYLDICGNENDANGSLEKLFPFLASVQTLDIPTTVHVAEMTEEHKKTAESNMSHALSLPHPPSMLAHSVLLNLATQDNDKMLRAQETIIHERLILLLNISSNMFTGTGMAYAPDMEDTLLEHTQNLEKHRLLLYFLDPQNSTWLDDTMLCVNTDDPVIIGKLGTTQATEIDKVAKAASLIAKNIYGYVLSPTDFIKTLDKKIQQIVLIQDQRIRFARENARSKEIIWPKGVVKKH